jgi:predicted AAA+ superfamily ATPase
MFEFLFQRYHYFIVVELGDTLSQAQISPKVLRYIKRFFFFKGYRMNYFEPFTKSIDGKIRIITGTDNKKKSIKRNTMIFLLELFAHLNNPELYTVSNDFPVITKIVDGVVLKIYKIKK